MNSEMLVSLIPIVAILATFGFPPAIVFIVKYFKLKNRELDIEAELQKKWGEDNRRQLEARVASLETAVSAMLQIVVPRPQTQQAPSQLEQLARVAEGPPPAGDAAALPPGQRERT